MQRLAGVCTELQSLLCSRRGILQIGLFFFFRTIGNETNPPILPWVTDFSSEIDVNKNWNDEENILTPWRDLTKTKYRLHKGDEQLDHSYTYSAHHVPEPISDLTVSSILFY